MQDLHHIATLALPNSDVYFTGTGKSAKYIDSAKQDYSQALDNYLLIRSSSLLICNNVIGPEVSLQLIFAMLEGKQIILVDRPSFINVGSFEKDFILKRLNKIFIYNLGVLEPSDRKELFDGILSTAKSQNYVITRHESVIAKARIKKYLNDLL